MQREASCGSARRSNIIWFAVSFLLLANLALDRDDASVSAQQETPLLGSFLPSWEGSVEIDVDGAVHWGPFELTLR